jgi:hypothetical protein
MYCTRQEATQNEQTLQEEEVSGGLRDPAALTPGTKSGVR